MCYNKWKFSEIPRSEEIIFSPLLEYFYNKGLDALVRENIQNSLDGRDKCLNREVEVRIDLGRISKSRLPGIDEIEKHIMSLSGHNDYTKKTISHMQEQIKKEMVGYLTFEDLNTKGLSGASNGSNFKEGDTFGIYAYKKGVHNTDKDSDFESMRGGSHGVGKIASNAASDVNLMYFANCDENCEMHLGGSVQLVEHLYNNKFYRATGYFTDEKDGVFYPYKNKFDKVFGKDTRGLKIIIPYLREKYNDKNAIIRAVCDNFFIAILEGKLVVEVCGKRIDKESIYSIINDNNIYDEEEVNEKNNFTKLYIDTYKTKKKESVVIDDRDGNNYKFDLYFQYDEEIKKGRMGIVRSIGMKIEDFKITSHSRTCFNAVLIPSSLEEDKFLKSLEDKSHTSLSYEHIKNEDAQKNAKRFINNLNKYMAKYIEEKIRSFNPTDGKIDTGDLIYSVETNFRKSLKSSRNVVEISKGDKNKKLTKTKGKVGQGYNTRGEKGKTTSGKGTKRKRRTLVKSPNGNDKKEKVSYEVISDVVKRFVLGEYENIFIDLSNERLVKNKKNCDIYIKIIDGDGSESKDKVNIRETYLSIKDENTSKEILTANNNCISGVSISEDKKIHLKMKISDKANKFLKYKYFVEV